MVGGMGGTTAGIGEVTERTPGTSLAVHRPMQGVRVRSLVGELRSHMPRGQKTKTIKQKQYSNKFNKDFKNGPHPKKREKIC